MTKEQWLVYLWSIYPEGGFLKFWIICLIITLGIIVTVGIFYYSDMEGYDYTQEEKDKYLWNKLGKWKLIVPSILFIFIVLSNFVPKKEYVVYIIATPYVVDSGKSIVENLKDPNSKLFKINQITDKTLDKYIEYLDKLESKE